MTTRWDKIALALLGILGWIAGALTHPLPWGEAPMPVTEWGASGAEG